MSFECPRCHQPKLAIKAKLELPPDDWNDEIALQTIACKECGFKGVARYDESRRGGGDSFHHRGFDAPTAMRALAKLITACPNPRSRSCECASHRAAMAAWQDWELGDPFRMEYCR